MVVRKTEAFVNRAKTCALSILVSVLLVTHSLAQQSPALSQPDRPASSAAGKELTKPGIEKIAQCREALRKAEAEHPGNTVEVAEALDNLVASQIDAHLVD